MEDSNKNKCLFLMDQDDIQNLQFDDFQQLEQNNQISSLQLRSNKYVFGKIQQLHQNKVQFDPFNQTKTSQTFQRIHMVKKQRKNNQSQIQIRQLNQPEDIFQQQQLPERQDFKGKRRNKAKLQQNKENVFDFSNQQPNFMFKKDKNNKLLIENDNLIIKKVDKKCVSDQSSPEKQEKQMKKTNIEGITVLQSKTAKLEYIEDKKAIKVSNMRQFVFTPLSPIFKITAVIKKQNSGVFSFNQKYTVFIQQNNKFILSIQKKSMSNYYIMSLSRQNINDTNKNYLGKLFTNFSGSQWTIFDSGFDPSQTRVLQQCRKQQSEKGPRKFSVLAASNGFGYFSVDQKKSVLQQKKQSQEVKKLRTKQPEYDRIDDNYKLDFKGIVQRASVKNFILVNDKNEECMIFGRKNQDSFIMQIKAPLSVFQASALCIASINYKPLF